jgi:NAD(P)-dependent dehydrogenase (short-subunit alcohol dehydrogenase family)
MKKRILVTGGSRGIGKSIVELLANDAEFEVIAPIRSELDLLSTTSIDNYFISAPEFYGLVNTAAINILSDLEKIEDENIEKMFMTNMIAPLKLIQHIITGMRNNGGGKIVNFSSIWGVRSKEKRTLYSMTKFGVCGMTKALAREFGKDNILVNSIAPGYVLTEMTYRNVSADDRKKLCKEIPLQRMAEPIEIAKVVKFLLSDENSYITGQNIVIDGGFLA